MCAMGALCKTKTVQHGAHKLQSGRHLSACFEKYFTKMAELKRPRITHGYRKIPDCKGGSIIVILGVILRLIFHYVVVPVGYAQGFVCLLSCALGVDY